MIERAQFARNKRIYEPGAFKAEMGSEGSLLEWFIRETESFHGEWGRGVGVRVKDAGGGGEARGRGVRRQSELRWGIGAGRRIALGGMRTR